MSLWETRPKHRRRGSATPTPEERRDMATAWGEEGYDKKACAALMSQGLCPDNAETVKVLEALHPRGSRPATRPLQELPLAPEVAPEVVSRCLRDPSRQGRKAAGRLAQHYFPAHAVEGVGKVQLDQFFC